MHDRSQCDECRKVAHKRRKAALDARAELIAKGKAGTKDGPLEVYPCPHGHGWHVGHNRHKKPTTGGRGSRSRT